MNFSNHMQFKEQCMRKGRTCATFLAKTGDSTCKKMWNLCICRRTRVDVSGGKPEESKENEKNKFSKLQLMRSIGFLDAKLNPKTLRFDRSIGDTLNCLLKMFCKISFVAKFYVSSLFEREDTIQLFIGSLFNFLPTTPRAFLGIVVSICCRIFDSVDTYWQKKVARLLNVVQLVP